MICTPRFLGAQRGVSLIEMMIALVLSLFIMLAIASVFFATSNTDRAQGAFSRIQENSRFGFEAVGRAIRRAGYRVDGSVSAATVFTGATIGSFAFVAGQKVAGTASTLALRYQGAADGLSRDCLGGVVAANAIVSEVISVVGGQLLCQLNAGAATPLVDGVQDIHFTYGEDTDGDLSVNGYYEAAAVANWTNVRAVKAEILLVSGADKVATAAQPYTFNGVTTTPTDTKLRSAFVTTYALRN